MLFRFILISALIKYSASGFGQIITIEETYDRLTAQWLKISDVLKDYQGLSEFCVDPDFRSYTKEVLTQIHHYDSVVLDFLNEPGTEALIGHHEYKKTMKDISKFEGKYSIKAFYDFLNESCITRNGLERDRDELELNSGIDSYDGQIVVLQADVNKFLKHIDRRVVAIDEHLHRIHPDRFDQSPSLTANDE